MTKTDTPEQAAFRDHCRRWLHDNQPGTPPSRLPELPIEVVDTELFLYLRDWQRRCYEAGLIGCDYPKEYGGGGYSGFQAIALAEIRAADVPYFINVVGLNMVAPVLLHHGSEEQKRRFLPPLFSADEIWCQGFSEPGAGSDLANARTRAVRNGDEWTVNGHKVWTSLAHCASWMILLARTGNEDKYGGLTYFIAPIADTPGVTVRPLIKMTGQAGFNEVLFEDVVVPDRLRVDDVGNGWQVAMTTLLHERGAAEGAGGIDAAGLVSGVNGLVGLAQRMQRAGKPAWQDAVLRDRIVQILIRAEGLQQLMRRMRVPALNEHAMRLPLQLKLLLSELVQDAAMLGLDIAGAHGSLYLDDVNAPDQGAWPLAYLNSFGFTIAGGTSEVQRNILGERVLGLAKSK